jgi:uncharacterized 2Fe-2S/4Fe-4S cluster protein (DUF4445 family)
MAEVIMPCEHVVSLLRSVTDGLAACPRCKIYAQKKAGEILASRTPFATDTALRTALGAR